MPDKWCKEHKTVWFKKGNMRGFAHPIVGDDGEPTGKWCNEPTTPAVQPQLAPPIDNPAPDMVESKIAPQERGMWWKEVGENFRAGLFKKDDNANGQKLWNLYVKQMLTSLEITLEKEVKPTESKLVAEAKKLGAKEVKKGGLDK